MARVYIPVSLRSLTDGQQIVETDGRSVGEVIASLEANFPGIKARLCQDDELNPGLSVAVDGSVSALGLLQRVESDSELHFLPAIGGGS